MADNKHSVKKLKTFLIDINDDDDESIEKAAQMLGVPADDVRSTLTFSREVFIVAEAKKLTKGQLLTSLMSVVSLLIKDTTDTEEERAEICTRLFEGLWVAAEIEQAPKYSTDSGEIVH
jgi:hypothetical protein